MITDKWKRLQSYIATKVMLGGLLPNDGYLTGVRKVIFHDQSTSKLTNGGNVGAGLDLIHTFTLPANSLKNDGDILDLWYIGDYATNDNDKRVVGQFNGTIYEDTGPRDIDVATGWGINYRISRVSSTSVIFGGGVGCNSLAVDSTAGVITTFTEGYVHSTRSSPLSGLPNLNSNSIALEVFAEGVANDDITITQVIIGLTRFS